jgi:hypothetical protein
VRNDFARRVVPGTELNRTSAGTLSLAGGCPLVDPVQRLTIEHDNDFRNVPQGGL